MESFIQCPACNAIKWRVQFHLNPDGTREDVCKACAAGIPRFWSPTASPAVVENPAQAARHPLTAGVVPAPRLVRAEVAVEEVPVIDPPRSPAPTTDDEIDLVRSELALCAHSSRSELLREMSREWGWPRSKTLRVLRHIEAVAV